MSGTRAARGVHGVCGRGRHALPRGAVPWFDVAGRRTDATTIVFGHWGRLGLLVRERLLGIDTGCVWGNCLTAYNLDSGERVQCTCPAED